MTIKHLFFFCFLILSILVCKPAPQKTVATIEPSLETMIGQMIMVGFRGMETTAVTSSFLDQIKKGYVGGIVLFDYDIGSKAFKRNIQSPAQVKELIKGLQNHAPTFLLMAVDQEGGKVNRLKTKYGFPKSVTAKYLGTLNNLDSTTYYAIRNAQTLKDLGFNVNFAPVVDIDLNQMNPVIGKYERSYANSPEIVIKHSTAWIKAQQDYGILSTLKHFPGHGSSDADSHEGVTDITNYWQELELSPFKALSNTPQVAIMTAHVMNKQLDAEYPATLSKKIISGILRDKWKFDGLVFSDDLQMKAVNQLFDFETILKKSIEAGVDVLVFGNNLEYDEQIPEKAVEAIAKMVAKGDLSKERIQISYERIMAVKENWRK